MAPDGCCVVADVSILCWLSRVCFGPSVGGVELVLKQGVGGGGGHCCSTTDSWPGSVPIVRGSLLQKPPTVASQVGVAARGP
jgi:hypothetical protein